MSLLLAVGDCFSAFVVEPVLRELRARSVPFRVAAGACEAELDGLQRQLGAAATLRAVGDVDDAKRFAGELLAARTTIVVYLGVGEFTRHLAREAATRDVRVVRLDAGVRVYGRPLPEHPWADAWCVAGALERDVVLAQLAADDGDPRPVAVGGDLVHDAVAMALGAAERAPHGVAVLSERESWSGTAWQERLQSSELPVVPPPPRDADVAAWVAYAAGARVVVTDSVGWQRVAVALGVPCAVHPASGLWAPGVAAGLVTQMEPALGNVGATLARAGRQPRGARPQRNGAAARTVDLLLAPASVPPLTLPGDGDASGRTFTDDEAALVSLVLQRGTLNSTRGTMVTTFEHRFARWLGTKHAIACASGSAAMHCAIAALRLSPGDEVVTTPITDMGALTPILYEGGVPVFADVDPVTMNVTPATVAARLTDRTRAIVATHLFGLPCDLDGLRALANDRGVPLIEDAAQAFGATWRGAKAGTHGALAAFSLQQGKHITTGEGGIVATDDDELARRVFLFVNKAWGYGDPKPDHYFPALNYRLTELQGAVAIAQLPKLDGVVDARRAVAAALRAQLVDVPGLVLPHDPQHGTHSWWKFAFHVDGDVVPGGAVALGRAMQQAGVACVPRYVQKPAFECELFRDWSRSPVTWLPLQHNPRLLQQAAAMFDRRDFPGAARGLDRVVVLPINERYTTAHVDHVARTIRAAVQGLQHA